MNKTYYTDTEGAKIAAEGLINIFGKKSENKQNYSKGFLKWTKLSLAKKKALMIKNNFSYDDCISELENN